MTLVLTLLVYGCPLHAMVVALGFDERMVAVWEVCAGRQGQAMQAQLVEPPRALGQGHADVSRVS
jgi:hypothetical protein